MLCLNDSLSVCFRDVLRSFKFNMILLNTSPFSHSLTIFLSHSSCICFISPKGRSCSFFPRSPSVCDLDMLVSSPFALSPFPWVLTSIPLVKTLMISIHQQNTAQSPYHAISYFPWLETNFQLYLDLSPTLGFLFLFCLKKPS